MMENYKEKSGMAKAPIFLLMEINMKVNGEMMNLMVEVFLLGKKEGKGTYTETDGTKYEGQWKNDLQDGQGTFSWNEGTKYEGGFSKNKYHGKGNFFWNNNSKFEGSWDNGKKT